MMTMIDWKNKLHWTDEHLEELRNTGYSYIRQGKYDIALTFFEALVILEKENAYDLQTLGALYLQMNRASDAISYLEESLKIDADHSPTLLNLAKAFFMSNRLQDGYRLVKILEKDRNPYISGSAQALVLTYSKELPLTKQ